MADTFPDWMSTTSYSAEHGVAELAFYPPLDIPRTPNTGSHTLSYSTEHGFANQRADLNIDQGAGYTTPETSSLSEPLELDDDRTSLESGHKLASMDNRTPVSSGFRAAQDEWITRPDDVWILCNRVLRKDNPPVSWELPSYQHHPPNMHFAMLLFPGFEALDAFGSLEVLNVLSERQQIYLSLLASSLAPVSTRSPDPAAHRVGSICAQEVLPTGTFADFLKDAPAPDTAKGKIDVLVVPGGAGTRFPHLIDPVIEIVRAIAPSVKYIMSVCNGAGVLARAGVLDGRRATTNKMLWKPTTALRGDVRWVREARWVADGKVWTSSGMASFGFSTGDFIAVAQVAIRIRKRFNDAPNQFNSISHEVRSLTIILQDIEVALSGHKLSTQQQTDLVQILGSCRCVLEDLEKALDKYQVLESRDGNLGEKIKRTWKRVSFEPADVCELRDRITSNVTILHTFLGRVSSQTLLEIKHAVKKIDMLQEDHERLQILDWLTTVDYSVRQADLIALQQEGIPGAGKTVCTALAVDDLTRRFKTQKDVGVAYVYCEFNRWHEQKAGDLLINILKQLCLMKPSLPDGVMKLHKQCNGRKNLLRSEDISETLQLVAAMFSKVFVVIDALDECQTFDGSQAKFLAEIFKLQSNSATNIFATSRPTHIPEPFRDKTALEIHASEADVNRYLEKNMFRLPGFVNRSPGLQEEIRTSITKRVDGMFLLAKLYLESLIGKRSPTSIYKALSNLSTVNDEYVYDRAYEKAMDRINDQADEQRHLAKQALSWITCAKRPLTSTELQHALALEEGQSTFDMNNVSDMEDIISVCAGLVAVDKESHVVRLVHYSTQEFFDRTRRKWFPDAENEITIACITYLSFDCFTSGYCQSVEEFEQRMTSNPLYDYAVQSWGEHAKSASNAYQQIITFLCDQAKVDASSQALMVSTAGQVFLGAETITDPLEPELDEFCPRETHIMGIHLAAYFGFHDIISALIENQQAVDVTDDWGHTPLMFGAGKGHKDVVRKLLDEGAIIDAKDIDGRTALSWATEKGHAHVVELLIDNNADVNTMDIYAGSPLLSASRRGHLLIVQALLDKGADSSLEYDVGKTAIHLALEHGHRDIARYFIAKDANINARGQSGQTALCLATQMGYKDVVELLLEESGNSGIDAGGPRERAVLVASLSDPRCPNTALHRSGGDNDRHPIDAGTLVKIVKEQLDRDLDHNFTPMGFCGGYSAPFKVTCAAHGYTVVGKATTSRRWKVVSREADIYRILQRAQGSAIPVFLGAIDFSNIYFLHGAGDIRHMLLMGWGGEDLSHAKPERSLDRAISRSLMEIRSLGVLHQDLQPENIL
ncbi:hypothetical protein KXW27_002712 [Aspergillus fumigatus]|nr:hypothetical protein KXW27_002712 [Aspergillus fumigatus]